MGKIYTALGLMSGTSMDGIDASIVSSIDGERALDIKTNQFFDYDNDFYQKLANLRDKISSSEDLKKYSKELKSIEKEITLFHAKVANTMIKNNSEWELDIIGFHGQTIFHDSDEKLSVQLGDGNLLSQLTNKTVVYNFRQNDLENGGQGAPLTPSFHQIIKSRLKADWWPVLFLNIGGISNVTSTSKFLTISKNTNLDMEHNVFAGDIAPGNCLIDKWVRKNSKKKYDKDGLIAKSGKVNQLVLNQALDNYSVESCESSFPRSLDIGDYDISFARGLSLEDGAATLTHLTAGLISEGLIIFLTKSYPNEIDILSRSTILISEGGSKNKYLIEILKNNFMLKK